MTNQTVRISTKPKTSDTTRLHNPYLLRLMRYGWLAVAIVATLMFLVNLPGEYVIFRDAPNWGGGYAEALAQIGLSPDFLAAYTTAVDMIVVLPAIALAFVVFRRRGDDWLALLVSITMILYAVSLTMAFYLASDYISWFVQSGSIALLLWIAFTFPDGRWLPTWAKWVLIGTVLIDAGLMLSETSSAIAIHVIAFPLGLLAMLMRYRRTRSQPVQHQQVRWVLWGFLLAFFASAIYDIIPTLFPALHSVDWTNPVFSVPSLVVFLITNTLRLSTSLIFVVIIGMAVIRYRLWDLDLTINRSLVYGLLTIILGVIFVLSGVVLRAVLGQEQSGIAFAVALVGAGALFNPTRKQLQRFIDRRLYGFRFDLNELAHAQQTPEIKNPGLLTGRTLGAYQVLGVLGKGGMGEVYQGVAANKVVAIKILPPDLAQQDDFRKRFEREGYALAQLNHPHIVRFYEAGETDNVAFMALEFIEGRELTEVIRLEHPMSLEDAHALLADCAAALDYAHAQGFIHRDIKPSNIMVRPTSDNEEVEAIVMDFGVAKMRDSTTLLTGTGAIGTIDYMAPEQILAAKEVDARADVYALGIVAYEMLTGKRPFQGNPGQVLFAHLQQPAPDIRDVRPELSAQIAHALEKALAKDPTERFATASDFVAALV
jgi:predicted Ser/Thr protein kinase